MLKKIWLKGFRNLDEGVFEFAEKGNVFLWGANNQGKTNFLEALFFLGNGGSPREDNLKNLVGFSAETLFLGGDFADVEGVSRVYFKVSSMGKREGSFNEKRLTRISALRERFPIAFISADAIRIFQESGSFRRRDLDRFCAGFIDGYGANIKRLERIIRQKNQLLKSNPSDEAIRLWNNQLVSVAATVVSGRKLALEKLGLVMESLLKDSDILEADTVTMTYHEKGLEEPSVDYQAALMAKLEGNIQKEVMVGYSLYGPHRDDFDIIIDGKALTSFYSRGINRTFAILVSWAQMVLLREKSSVYPILLLDDAFAELDPHIKKQLVTLLDGHAQIFYTSVIEEDRSLFSNVVTYNVREGSLVCE